MNSKFILVDINEQEALINLDHVSSIQAFGSLTEFHFQNRIVTVNIPIEQFTKMIDYVLVKPVEQGMRAWHFLQANWTSYMGQEKPWTIGERRDIPEPIVLGSHGYHYSTTIYGALANAQGSLCCMVEVAKNPQPFHTIGDIGVSSWRRLIKSADITKELQTFALKCSEVVLRLDSWPPEIYDLIKEVHDLCYTGLNGNVTYTTEFEDLKARINKVYLKHSPLCTNETTESYIEILRLHCLVMECALSTMRTFQYPEDVRKWAIKVSTDSRTAVEIFKRKSAFSQNYNEPKRQAKHLEELVLKRLGEN